MRPPPNPPRLPLPYLSPRSLRSPPPSLRSSLLSLRSGAIALTLAASGCVHTLQVDEQMVAVPSGRFVGPLAIKVPTRASHAMHDLEMEVVLTARCGPRLEVAFPDGEVEVLSPWTERDGGSEWQSLLARRAEGEAPRDPAPAVSPVPDSAMTNNPPLRPATTQPSSSAITYDAPFSRNRPPPPVRWHVEAVETESWPGQRRFLALRDERCAEEASSFRVRHLVSFEERSGEPGGVSLFARVPQELFDASVRVTTWEIVPPPPRAPRPPKPTPQPRAEPPRVEVAIEAHATVEVKSRPVPPMPRPKKENPGPAKTPGARFQPGHWAWIAGDGNWVWIEGFWEQPQTMPGPLAERPGPPAIAGARWHVGHWEWWAKEGEWRWIDGYWIEPAPLAEQPGAPPEEGSQWEGGRWTIDAGAYVWLRGRWRAHETASRPPSRVELPGPPPFPNARWVPGDWLLQAGKWVWLDGEWLRGGIDGDRPPPLPRAETPPPAPSPDAVWLAGYWRWMHARADYEWMPGHWERPPGAGYVWVPDPLPPTSPLMPRMPSVPSGHWEIRVRVNLPVPRVRP